jgi:hypothetical protein
LALLLAAGALARPVAGQVRASVRIGVGTVRTERRDTFPGASFTSAMLSPAVRYASSNVVIQASGYVASLPAGAKAGQGRLQLWGVTPRLTGRWRLGAEGILTGTTRTGGSWTTAAHGVGELLWSTPRWGFGLGAGPSTGRIANDAAPPFVALHTRARSWWRPGGGAEWQLSVEPTRFFGAWFTDVGAGVTLQRGRAFLTLSADGRLSSVYGSTGAGSAFLQLFPARAVSIELGGGSYLREPYQGFPRGGFVSFGVRLGSTRPLRSIGAKAFGPLVPQVRGDSLVVQFRFPGVQTVAIAGDWDGWQTHPLRSAGANLWEGAFVIARGVHHFNLLVDGRTWVVPAGVATVPDGLGGVVAVLIVR